MCQGVIVSLVKWQGKSKRVKRCVLSGIGSHSQLLADNSKKLERLGWRDNAPGQKVYSIESDFSAWNKFSLAGDEPDKSELAILKREYKKCAGSAKALIAHVKRCGKIDDALERLFTSEAKSDYEAKRKPLDADYEAKRRPLDADYEAKRKPLHADYEAKRKPLDADYEAKRKPLDADYEAKRRPLYADYEAKRKPLYADYEAKRKPLDADYEAKRLRLWVKTFAKKSNRIASLQ